MLPGSAVPALANTGQLKKTICQLFYALRKEMAAPGPV